MKRKISLILSMLLVLSMVFALTGCGGGNAQKALVGEWEASLDMKDFVNEGMKEDEEMAEYLMIDEFVITLKFAFNEDGTYKMSSDESSIKEALEGVKNSMVDGLNRYFEDYIAESGLDMSVEDVLALSGTTLDELAAEAFGDNLAKEVADSITLEGNYKAEGGKLYLSDGTEHLVDKNVYYTYELSGGELKLLAFYGQDDEFGADMYPIVFKKVN